ncbi:MAG: hypothetical protein ACRYG8_42355 [Janthinobacterium lividum]
MNRKVRATSFIELLVSSSQASSLRRPGLAEAAMHQTLTGVVAELLADALIGAGCVVALPRPGSRRAD